MANLAMSSISHTMQHLKRHNGVIYDEPTKNKSTLGVKDDIERTILRWLASNLETILVTTLLKLMGRKSVMR